MWIWATRDSKGYKDSWKALKYVSVDNFLEIQQFHINHRFQRKIFPLQQIAHLKVQMVLERRWNISRGLLKTRLAFWINAYCNNYKSMFYFMEKLFNNLHRPLHFSRESAWYQIGSTPQFKRDPISGIFLLRELKYTRNLSRNFSTFISNYGVPSLKYFHNFICVGNLHSTYIMWPALWNRR